MTLGQEASLLPQSASACESWSIFLSYEVLYAET